MAKEARQHGYGHPGTFHEAELKICDLCGSLNLESNPDCFVCGWHGRFERNAEIVRTAVEIAVRRYGRLELQHLTDVRTHREAPPNLQSRFHSWLDRLWNWLRG